MTIQFLNDLELESIVGGEASFPVPADYQGVGAGGLPVLYNDTGGASNPNPFMVLNPQGTQITTLMNGTIAPGVIKAAANAA